MAEDDVVIKLRADVDEFKARIASARKEIKRLGTELDKTAQEAETTNVQMKKTTGSSEKMSAAARAVGGRFGELAERFANAHKALGTFGVTMLGTSAALTAGAAALAVYVGGAIALTKEAIRLADEMEGIIDVTEEETEALNRADGSFRALERSVAALTVTAGSDLAPVLGDMAETLAQVTLAAEDLADTVGIDLGDAFIGLLGVGGNQVVQMFEALDMLTKEYEDDVRGLAAEEGDLFTIWQDGLDLLKQKEEVLKEIRDRKQEALDIDKEVADRMAAEHKAFMDYERKEFEAEKERLKFSAKQDAIRAAEKRALEEEELARFLAAIEEKKRAEEEFARLQMEQQAAMVAAEKAAFAQIAEAYIEFFVGQFENEKASAIASIMINAAKMVATLAGQGVPLPIAVGLGAGMAAIQIAEVNKAEAPTAHLGERSEFRGAPGGSGAGEIATLLQPGEIVQTARQARQPTVILNQFEIGHRTMDAAIKREVLVGGTLRERTRKRGAGQMRYSRG